MLWQVIYGWGTDFLWKMNIKHKLFNKHNSSAGIPCHSYCSAPWQGF